MPWRTSQRRGSPVLWETAASQETVVCSARGRRLLTQSPSGFFLSREEVAGVGRGGFLSQPARWHRIRGPVFWPSSLPVTKGHVTFQKPETVANIGIVLFWLFLLYKISPFLASFSSAREHFLLTLPLCFLRRPEAERKSLYFVNGKVFCEEDFPGESVTQAGLAEGGLTLWRPQRPLEAASLEKGVQSFLLQQQASGPRFQANDKPVLFQGLHGHSA